MILNADYLISNSDGYHYQAASQVMKNGREHPWSTDYLHFQFAMREDGAQTNLPEVI